MMSIAKIKQLRSERMKQIDFYRNEIEKIKNDNRLSNEYKRKAINEHENNLNAARQSYDEQINELIQKGKSELKRKISNAEFEGVSNENLMRKLLIENRNRDITARAMDQYRGRENELYKIVQSEVENLSPTAPGYINAYLRLIDDPILKSSVEQMEQEYKNNTMNVLQKEYTQELQQYVQQEQEYSEETGNEAFEQILTKYKN